MTAGTEPLFDRAMDAVLFRTAAGPVTAAAFLHDASRLARRLPGHGDLVNLCRDRYAFAVAFAAALLCGRTCLLPGDRSPAALAALAAQHPAAGGVCDEPPVQAPWPTCQVDTVPHRQPAGPAPLPLIARGHVAAIAFTSGSTGAPAAHRKTWGMLVARSRAAGARFGLDAAAPGTVVGTVPPQHMYGFETTVLLPLHAACASWCGAAFYPGDVQAALDAVPAPRILVTTPLQLHALLRAGAALPPLQATISATAPLDAGVAATAEAQWGAPVQEIFGATESGSIASRRTIEAGAWQTYPGLALRRAGPDTVVDAPGAAAVALADRVELLPDGRFRVLGRRADLVKLGGRRASLSGLTQVLIGLDGVVDGAFVAPDDLDQRSTARLLAVVVAPGRSASSVLADLRGRIDPVFLPRRIVRVDALPRNQLGKLPRQALLSLLAGAA